MKLTTVISLILCGAAVAVTASAQQSLTWDPGKTGGSGGTGTWDLSTTADWYNGSSDVDWLDNSALGANIAIFGASAGTVTLNSSVSASNLLFNTTGYTISGSGTLTLGVGGINASSLTSGTTTIGVGLLLPAVQNPWQVGSGGTLAINGAVNRSTGATVDFSAIGITTTSPNLVSDADGILGGWATSGNSLPSNSTGDFATVTNGVITICTNYTLQSAAASTSPNLTGVSGQNWVSGALNGANNVTTITNSVTIHSLIQQGDFVVNEGDTLTLGSGGLILRGISRWLIDQAAFDIGTASIESGLASGELFVHTPNGDVEYSQDGGNWRIWPIIKDNGATPAKLIKDGPGCVILQNYNSYSGGTFIENGILVAGGETTSQALEPVTLGTGAVTINKGGVLEFGLGTANANLDYDITNNIIMLGGAALADDGHQHLTGAINVQSGGILGSTYDGGANGSTGNKGLFIDGVVSGSGPLFLEQSVMAGDNDRYGNGGGNGYNSSIVEFTNNANTYSGTITIVPYTTGGGAGSYLAINAANALQFATINLNNNTGGQRFAGTPLIFLTGLGSATVAGITGSGNIILNGYNENTYARQTDPIALTVGGNNANAIYSGNISGSGSFTKAGTGSLTNSGANTYTGNTTVSGGKLVLTGSFLDSTDVIISAGATLDSSALGTATLASGQNLLSSGTMSGSLTANSGAEVSGDSGSGYGTNVLNNNLTLNSGALLHFSVSSSTAGPNDLITVAGTLSANNNIVHLSAPSSSVSLQTADYTLLTSANPISGSFLPAPFWDAPPANPRNYSIVVSGNTVKLHYSATTIPIGGGSATPNPALRNQNVLITVTTTNGSGGTVNSVVVNASPIGGSSSLALVSAGGNVWTNSVIVAPGTPAGVASLLVTITDTASMVDVLNILLTVNAVNDVWNGAGANANFSTALNWTNGNPPGYVGDSMEFAGTTQLSPNMDNNYSITALLFDTNAGAFNISSGNSSVLTLTGGITNNSPNAQTLGVVIGGVNGLTKSGAGAVNLTASETYTGNTVVRAGTLNISGNLASTNSVSVGSAAGNTVMNLSGSVNISPFYVLLGNTANSAAAVYQTAGSVSATANSGYDNLSVGNVGSAYGYYDVAGGTLTAAGVCVAGEDNGGAGANFGGAGGNGIMEVQNGATVNDTSWFVMTRNTGGAQTGILNVYSGGTLTVSPPAGGWFECNWGSGQTTAINVWGTVEPPLAATLNVGLGGGTSGTLNLEAGGLFQAGLVSGAFGGVGGVVNFDGGTLQSLPQLATPVAAFISASSAYSYNGGAIIDDDGSTVTNSQPLLAPGGDGIYSASVTTGGAGYIAPPIVTIVRGNGDTTGTGATAIAQINPATGTVIGVTITSPGQNYTATPTFTLTGGGATTQATITSAAPTPNASGGLSVISFAGGGKLVLTGVSTYTGSTVVSNDVGSATTLGLAGNGSIAASTNVTTQASCVFDVSALSSYTLASGQVLSGLGNVNGSVTAGAGSYVSAGQGGTLGVNTFNNNLTLATGAAGSLALTTTYNGQNDKVVVTGTLTVNNNVIHLSAPSTSSSLDTTADYVLITATSISGSFSAAPVWDVAPANAGHYSIVTSGTQVTLHYNAAVVVPSVTATVTPSTLLRNQPTLVTANVTPGSASISTVKADFTPVGGAVVSLVESNTSSLYTNTVAVPPSAAAGNDTVTITATDSANNSGSTSLQLTIITGNDVWNGAGGNANFSTGLNWTNKLAPGYVGDSLEFAGTTQLSPNMDNSYTISSLEFDTNAGAFNISSADASVVTMSGNTIVNNSPNTQTLNVPVADSGGGITESGAGGVTLAGNNTYTGPTVVNAGTLNISGLDSAASNSITTVGGSAGNSVLNVSGAGDLWAFSLLIGNSSNSVGAVYQSGGTVWVNTNSSVDNLCLGNVPGSYGYYDASGGTVIANGLCIGGEGNSGRSSGFGLSGSGIMDINGGTVNDTGWLVMARNNNNTNGSEIAILNVYSGYLTYAGGGLVGPWDTGESAIINVMGGVVSNTAAVGVYLGNVGYDGILNLNGGTLQASVVQGYNGPTYAPITYGQLNFNGGTLQASTAGNFIMVNGATVYGGGATINNNTFGITVAQPLLAPSGNGVHGITSFTGGAGYVAPPIITITNGTGDSTGTGATAIAQINPANGTVTNIIITCPGVNYTATPVFIVSGGGATVPATVTGATPTADTSGGLTATGSGTLTLTGTNTYTGATTISAGTLSLSGSGSIAASTSINVAAAGAAFTVPNNFVLGAAQTLEGIGTVNGNVTNNGTIIAGTGSSIGTFSFNNNLTLQSGGTTVVKLNKSLSTSDQIYCYGTLSYGGTLQVQNLAGTLQLGDSFTVFFTGGSSGNFAGISGSPGAGLAYSFNPSTGVISVVSGSAGIASLKFTKSPIVSGTSVTFSATNSGAGTVYMLTTTNIAPPVSWSPIWTNVLGGSSAFTTNLSNAVKAGTRQQFYELSTTNN